MNIFYSKINKKTKKGRILDHENIEEIIGKIKNLESQLIELAHKSEKIFSIENGKIIFSEDILNEQKKRAQNIFSYIINTKPKNIIIMPMIYLMIIPAIFLDLFIFIYQSICFPIYKIKKVSRKSYIVFDRQNLAYLNTIEKLNCLYCQYFNCLMAYATEVAAKTELYWCPIKHSKQPKSMHRYYYRFSNYGEYEKFKESWEKNRRWLRDETVN